MSLFTEADGKDKRLADSLISIANSETLSETEKFEILRKISHTHPDYSLGLEYANKALKLANKLNDPIFQAQAYEEISSNQRLLGNNLKSIRASLNALTIFEKLEMEVSKAATYVQLGSIMVSDGDYLSAITYFEDAIDIYKNNPKTILNYTYTIVNLGEVYRLNAQYDSAKLYFLLALEINERLNDPVIACYSEGNLGMTFTALGEYDEAKKSLNHSINLARALEDPYSTSVYLAELGTVHFKEHRYDLAKGHLLEAYQLAQNDMLKEQIRDFGAKLVELFEATGHFDKALNYQKMYQSYQDSLVNKANIQEMERIKASYEIEKRESEILLLSTINANQRLLAFGLGGGILIFGILSFLLYRSNQQKNNANKLLSNQRDIIARREEEKALLLRELNHRVKNNLQMVSSLLSLQGNELIGHPAADAISAGKYRVEALSLIHKKLYREDVHTRIDLQEYLEELTMSLFYSYNMDFKPTFAIEPVVIDIDRAIPLALIVNELVTNALKYAYNTISSPKMSILVTTNESLLQLEVIDNGTGIDQANIKSSSFGIKLVQSLVQQLEGTLEIRNSQPDGTHCIITIRSM